MKTPKDKPDKPPGQEKPPGHPGGKPPDAGVEPPQDTIVPLTGLSLSAIAGSLAPFYGASGGVSLALTGHSVTVNPGDVV